MTKQNWLDERITTANVARQNFINTAIRLAASHSGQTGPAALLTDQEGADAVDMLAALFDAHYEFDTTAHAGNLRALIDGIRWQQSRRAGQDSGSLAAASTRNGDILEHYLCDCLFETADNNRNRLRLRWIFRREAWHQPDDNPYYRILQRHLVVLLDRCYLHRYHLPGANRLARTLARNQATLPRHSRWHDHAHISGQLLLGGVMFIALLCIRFAPFPILLIAAERWLTAVTAGGVLLWMASVLLRYRGMTDRIILPRLVSGIAVGFLPILLTGELWTVIQQITAWWIPAAAAAGCLSLFVGYLFCEVRNVLRRDRPSVVLPRALLVAGRGFVQAMALGILMSAPLTGDYTAATDCATCLRLNMVLLGAPAALFIGVLLQIIWEDKPITAPL